MSDRLTIEQRHNNMAAIRGRDTNPEILVRKFLWSRGFRYRLNHPRLPGKPDIVLRKYRTCILVNGCFWHGHEGCKYYVVPKSNTGFWMEKIRRNRERDHEVLHRLAEMVAEPEPRLFYRKKISIKIKFYLLCLIFVCGGINMFLHPKVSRKIPSETYCQVVGIVGCLFFGGGGLWVLFNDYKWHRRRRDEEE